LVAVLTGCHYVGSGTVTSATGHGAATFTFDLNCPVGGNVENGVLTYIDSSAGVLIHGSASGVTFLGFPCVSNSSTFPPFTFSPGGDFNGAYTPLKGGTGGTFYLDVTPGSGSASTSIASFSLNLTGGVYNGYHNAGPVRAGSIVPVGGPNA
jgi:hypothetical protein